MKTHGISELQGLAALVVVVFFFVVSSPAFGATGIRRSGFIEQGSREDDLSLGPFKESLPSNIYYDSSDPTSDSIDAFVEPFTSLEKWETYRAMSAHTDGNVATLELDFYGALTSGILETLLESNRTASYFEIGYRTNYTVGASFVVELWSGTEHPQNIRLQPSLEWNTVSMALDLEFDRMKLAIYDNGIGSCLVEIDFISIGQEGGWQHDGSRSESVEAPYLNSWDTSWSSLSGTLRISLNKEEGGDQYGYVKIPVSTGGYSTQHDLHSLMATRFRVHNMTDNAGVFITPVIHDQRYNFISIYRPSDWDTYRINLVGPSLDANGSWIEIGLLTTNNSTAFAYLEIDFIKIYAIEHIQIVHADTLGHSLHVDNDGALNISTYGSGSYYFEIRLLPFTGINITGPMMWIIDSISDPNCFGVAAYVPPEYSVSIGEKSGALPEGLLRRFQVRFRSSCTVDWIQILSGQPSIRPLDFAAFGALAMGAFALWLTRREMFPREVIDPTGGHT